jgi:AraC-like DNA-binding protein
VADRLAIRSTQVTVVARPTGVFIYWRIRFTIRRTTCPTAGRAQADAIDASRRRPVSFMRAAVLANYVDVARQLGLNPAEQLRAAGLTVQMLRSQDRLISSDAVVLLLENSAAASGCETLGLRLAEARRLSHFGVVGLLLGQQRTVRDLLQMALRYLPLLNESLALQLEVNGNTALLREEVLTEAAMPARQTNELSMAANVQLFSMILGPDWCPRRVFFRHEAPSSLELHARVFRCRCEFENDLNAMSFPVGDLDAVNPAADPMMGQYAQGFIDTLLEHGPSSVVMRVRRLIYLLLPLRQSTIKQVAQSFGCSVRKLQLDLRAEDTSFAALLDEARKERVQLYLRNPKFEMGQVSALLGYRHQSAFTRWFTARFGRSPSAWRHSAAKRRGLAKSWSG